jgi:Raf kinase inhibitor-like YbhB/YbcL family protein
MHLRSPAFANGAEIPRKYTHDGDDVSPPLEWDDVPEAAKSLALVVEDPDAPDPAHPQTTWIHWVVADLPTSLHGLPEGVTTLPAGVMGLNDWDDARWGGPAPPIGKHRYIFKLYALDRVLGLKHPTKYELDRKIARAIVLAEATLTGTYRADKGADSAVAGR